VPEIGPEIPRVEEIAGEDEQHHQQRDRFARLMAIATVLTTLIAALVAFAQASAISLHDRADARAEAYGALALNAAAVNRGKAEVQIDRFNLLTRELRAASTASLFQQFGTDTAAARFEPKRWQAAAAQTEADTAAIAGTEGVAFICAPSLQKHCSRVNASYSPEQDPSFPNRFTQQTQWSSYRLTALRDASNQQADGAETQSVHYAAILTMLAVAVFLFGYSLTPQGRSRRRLFSSVAAGFVLVAGVWAFVQAVSPVEKPSDAAATAFANGKVQLETGNPEAAIVSFTRAVKLRPEFVDAYAERAQAEFDAGIPRTGSGADALPTTAGPVTVPSREALGKAVEDNSRRGRSAPSQRPCSRISAATSSTAGSSPTVRRICVPATCTSRRRRRSCGPRRMRRCSSPASSCGWRRTPWRSRASRRPNGSTRRLSACSATGRAAPSR
jgi:tetratricopeptide (TPR) repeat protein